MTPSWIIMPYVDNIDMTEAAIRDCLSQSIDVRILLIDQGSTPENYTKVFSWQVDERIFVWRHMPPLPALAATWNHALRFIWSMGQREVLVVNNDVRLHPETYAWLKVIQQNSGAWFVTGVGVRQEQFNPALDLAVGLSLKGNGREDTGNMAHIPIGGPDFSCYLINERCHRYFQFDEQFIPAYHEDNDYHRRLQLAGFGSKIFGVNLPFLHYGSATINRSPEVKAAWGPKFAACQAYYTQKWGGLPGHETFTTPFNEQAFNTPDRDPRCLLVGQGRNELDLRTYESIRQDLFNAQETGRPGQPG